jgi:hypothetical protein
MLPTRDQITTISVVLVLIISIGAAGLSGSAAAATSTEVSVTPATQTIDAGTTTTVNITVQSVNGGVGAYSFTLSSDDTGTVSFTDVQLRGNPGTSDVEITPDGSQVDVSAALADAGDNGPVTVATVTLAGDAAGESALTLSDVAVGDEQGNSYTINSVNDGSISVLESTTIQNVELTPDTVDEQQTTTTTVDFDVTKVSSDGNSDEIVFTAPSDLTLSNPSASVTGADGSTIQIESSPEVGGANGGSNNQVEFAIAPDNSINTSRIDVSLETDIEYPSVASNQSKTFDLNVYDSSGETATATTSATVLNSETQEGGGATQSVSVSPATQNLSAGETTEFDVVVDNVTAGIGAYDLNVTSSNASIAQITDVTLGGNPSDLTTTISYSDNDDRVSIEAALADTADTGEVTIVTVTVSGEAAGSADIGLDIAAIGDEDGNPIEISSVSDGSLTVKAGPGDVTGNGQAATDPDDDGVYEDINGDGAADVLDVQSLYRNLGTDAFTGTSAFDINGDGSVDILDVQALFAEL